MITEDYVTFEQAEKLKEVGFDSPCYTFYDIIFPKEGKPQFISSPYCNNYNINSEHNTIVSAPSLSLVQKWLREEKNINICIIACYNETVHWYYKFPNYQGNVVDTYEEALSAGIDKALEILK